MNTEQTRDPVFNQLASGARETVAQTTDAAKDAFQTVRAKADEAYQTVRAKADETIQTVRAKADETATRTNEYVRQHPLPSLLGAVAVGVALGYLLAITRRHEPTFREQFVEEPLEAARRALYATLAPVAERLHDGYDAARSCVGSTANKVHHFNGSRAAESVTDQLRRVGGNLKFW